MVLVMARRETTPWKWWPKTLTGRMENNSWKPRDPTKNRHSDSLKKGKLTLSQGMMKKEMMLQLIMLMR